MARRWRGDLTQVDASIQLGIMQSTLSRIETDARRPSVRLLSAMIEAYSVSDEDARQAIRLLGQLETAEEADE
jgi:transcriptional regulator with XRE-family HTH domain